MYIFLNLCFLLLVTIGDISNASKFTIGILKSFGFEYVLSSSVKPINEFDWVYSMTISVSQIALVWVEIKTLNILWGTGFVDP